MFKHVLVTGGAGFIGSELVGQLLESGYQVTVLDDLSTGKLDNLALAQKSPKFRYLQGTIESAQDVGSALQGCDAVLHLAVSNLRASIAQPELSHRVNAAGTLTLLEECRKSKISRFVYVSSSEIYGSAQTVPMSETHPLNPTTVYASSKLAGEYYALSYSKMYGMNCTVVRPFNNYGPRSHFEGVNGEIIPRTVVRLKNGLPPVIFGDGSQTRDFQFVSDTARGLIMVLENLKVDREIFNLAFGQEISMSALCQKLIERLAPETKIEYSGVNRPGDLKRHFASNEKFLKTFSYAPSIHIDEGLDRYLRWFDEQKFDLKHMLSETTVVNW